jgi:hypothetical protein
VHRVTTVSCADKEERARGPGRSSEELLSVATKAKIGTRKKEREKRLLIHEKK